jgi:hypothetical protein
VTPPPKGGGSSTPTIGRATAARGALFKGETERFECEFRYRGADGGWRWARQPGIVASPGWSAPLVMFHTRNGASFPPARQRLGLPDPSAGDPRRRLGVEHREHERALRQAGQRTGQAIKIAAGRDPLLAAEIGDDACFGRPQIKV